MNRILIIVVIAAAGIGAYYFLNQPEPTPAERVESAVNDAGEALGEAASAVSDGAQEAVEAATEQAAEAVEQATQAATETAEQVSEAASAAADQAEQTVSDAAEQATDAANEAAEAASEQVASLSNQAGDMFKTWQDSGILTKDGFDYDKLVAAVQVSGLEDGTKDTVLKILSDIKAAPESFDAKIQELRTALGI